MVRMPCSSSTQRTRMESRMALARSFQFDLFQILARAVTVWVIKINKNTFFIPKGLLVN